MKNDYYYFNDSLNNIIFNITSLTLNQKPEISLFCVDNVYTPKYFDTKEELNIYCHDKDISINNTYTMDYIRNFANQTDVIRKTYPNNETIYLTVVDELGYAIYNEEKSITDNNFVWDYKYGNLFNEYNAFRERNIIFEEDIYKEREEYYEHQKLLKKDI